MEKEDSSLLFSRSNFKLTISYANFSCKLWIATGHKKTLKIYKTNNSLWTSTWESLGYQYKSTLSKHYPDIKHQAPGTRHHTTHLCTQLWTVKCFPYMQFMVCVSKATIYDKGRFFGYFLLVCLFIFFFKSRLSITTAMNNTQLQRQSAVPPASMCCLLFWLRITTKGMEKHLCNI